MRWLDSITDSMDEFEQAPGVGDGQGSLVCCSPWDRKELDKVEGLNYTQLNTIAFTNGNNFLFHLMKCYFFSYI